MEAAIQTVVKVYLKSAKGKDSLGGKQFQCLVKEQLGNIMTDTDSAEAVKEMRQGLDANHDGKVSFEEYMKLVGYLATSLSQARSVSQDEPNKVEAAAAEPAKEEPSSEEPAQAAEVVAVAESAPVPEKEEVKEEEVTAKEAKADEEIPAPEVAVEEDKPAAEEAKEEEKAEEEVEKIEEAGEQPAVAADEEGEKKTEEEAS